MMMMKLRTRGALSTLAMVLAMSVIVLAAITAGNTVTGGSLDTNNVAATGAISTAGASLLVVGLGSYQGGAVQAVITDSPGGGGANTWTPHTVRNSTNARMLISHVTNPTVNASHTFATTTGNVTYPAISVQAFLGVDTSSPFDTENGANTGGATTLATGNVTPSANGAVLFACLTIGVVDVPTMGGSGWSSPVGVAYNVGLSYGVWCSYKIQTTATAEGATFNWSSSTEAAASITAFKVAGGGPAATPSQRLLRGCCNNIALQPGQSLRFTTPWLVSQVERGSENDRTANDQTQVVQILHKAEHYISTVSAYARGVRK